MAKELSEEKLSKKIWMVIFILMLVGMIICCYSLYRMKEIAENNPCIACAKLTNYVCVNKTDVNPFFIPDRDWINIHDSSYKFGENTSAITDNESP